MLIALVVPALPGARRADDGRLKEAELVLTEMAGSFDKGIPKSLLTKAMCVVIIPGVKKAALGVGGQYGRGYLSCRLDKPNSADAAKPVVSSRWSAPGGIRIEGGSVGLQIGGAETDIILLVMNKRGVDRLLANNFKVGADAAVAAGPVGREATAQTDITMRAEMLAWSRARGVFAGISLEICAAFPAITAVGKGLDAYVAVDACGTFSQTKREVGLLRMLQAGVIITDYASVVVEILKDNSRPDAGTIYGAIDMPWAKLVGQIAQAYAK